LIRINNTLHDSPRKITERSTNHKSNQASKEKMTDTSIAGKLTYDRLSQ
jgi:hypothetical protein